MRKEKVADVAVPRALLVEVKRRLLAKGYLTIRDACRAVDLNETTFYAVLKHGLRENPRVKTIEALRALGLLDLFVNSNGVSHK